MVHDAGPTAGPARSGCGAGSPTRTRSCSATATSRCTRGADGFQIFNPGSPTERRRAPQHTMGIATIDDSSLTFELIALD